MKRWNSIWTPWLASLLTGVTTAHAQMTVPATFSTSPSGAATYTIPIKVPPGIAGGEPKLALEYNSQGRVGLVGLGWSLSGPSAITRCPRTVPQDNVRGGVSYNADDRFCLDGERLVVVSGAYGAAESQYRTERDVLSKVVAYGVAPGGGPLNFRVWTRAGLILEYGTSTDSSVPVVGKSPMTVATWALRNVMDARGNSMTYWYVHDAGGDAYPTKIEYTSNANTGLQPTNSVIFEYESRPDVITKWRAGGFVRNSVRLSKIQTHVDRWGTSPALEYRVSYGPQAAATEAPTSVVDSITVCAASGEACLPAHRFTHEAGPNVTRLGPRTNLTSWDQAPWQGTNGSNPPVVGDFNGDGMHDLLAPAGGGQWDLCLATGVNLSCSVVAAHGFSLLHTAVGDFNGDGKTDMAAHAHGNTSWQVCLSTGSGFSCTTQTAHGGGVHPQYHNNVVGDFNGDGRADLAAHVTGGSTWHVCLSNGVGFDCSYQQAHHHGAYRQYETYAVGYLSSNVAGDFNGDGLTDLAGGWHDSDMWEVCLSTGVGFSCSSQRINPYGAYGNAPGDFNGDGLTDFSTLVEIVDGRGMWRVCLATGIGFDCSVWRGLDYAALDAVNRPRVRIGDFNGDGLTDMATRATSNGYYTDLWQLCISTGAAFNCALHQTDGVHASLAGDFNGDGLTDLITSVLGRANPMLTTAPSRRIASVDNSAGEVTRVTYDTLPRIGPRYTKSSNITGTRLPLPTPLAVVKDVETSNARGSFRRALHSYGTAVVERGGRGFLGFEWIQVHDEALGISSRNDFRLDFPFTGLVSKSAQGKGPSPWADYFHTTTASTTVTHDCLIPDGASVLPCNVAPGNRYVVYARQSETTNREPGGAALPGVRTINSNVDAYGNVQRTDTFRLNPSGALSEYSTSTTNSFYNDAANWRIGKLTKMVVAATGPTVPGPVVPGAGGNPTQPPSSNGISPAVLSAILSLLLDD